MSEPETGTLFLVSTPIGNLKDVTLRALEVLQDSELVLAEDTRRTQALFRHHRIQTPLMSHHAHSRPGETKKWIDRLLGGQNLSLVTDAGTPSVSDPGVNLVRAAVEAGIEVQAIPGPSAALAALVVSGLDTSSFSFFGFLPRSGKARKVALLRLQDLGHTAILYESPRRVAETLKELAEHLGNRQVVACRELTKMHEETVRGTAEELRAHFASETRGEFTLVIEGSEAPEAAPSELIRRLVKELLKSGLSTKDASRAAAIVHGVDRKSAYKMALECASTVAADASEER